MTKLSEEEKAAAKQRARERFLELGWDRRGPKTEEIEKLRQELQRTNERIQELREALGSNHPLGIRRGIFG